jgi:hypothetical protein
MWVALIFAAGVTGTITYGNLNYLAFLEIQNYYDKYIEKR